MELFSIHFKYPSVNNTPTHFRIEGQRYERFIHSFINHEAFPKEDYLKN
jgi:hypothetical protein